MAKVKKPITSKEKSYSKSKSVNNEVLISEEQVYDVIKFAGSLYSGIYTPQLVNDRMKDISLAGLEIGFKQIGEIYKGLVKKRRLKPTDLVAKYANITTTTTNEGVKHADLVLEAIIEDLDIKRKTLDEVERATKGTFPSFSTKLYIRIDVTKTLITSFNEWCR